MQRGRFLRWTGIMAGGFLSLTAFQAEGCGGGFAASFKKGRGWRRGLCKRVVVRFAQGQGKRFLRLTGPLSRRVLRFDGLSGRGLWYRPAGDEFYSFPSVLHTGARPSARDDDVGGHPYRHFDRSEAEWRNLTPPWFMKHWGRRSPGSELHIA